MIAREQRLSEILKAVSEEGAVKVGTFAAKFNVSTETIRKDVIYLEKRGLLTKGHGVAQSPGGLFVQHISQRVAENLEQKNRIAKKALEFIPPAGLIFLDSGSTVLCLAKLLRSFSGLTIVTCALNIANELISSNNKICLTGGDLKDTTGGLTGMWASGAIRSIRPDVTFLGTSGVMTHEGPTAQCFDDAEQKSLLLDTSRLSVVLMDSAKFQEIAPVSYARWSSVDYVVTESELGVKELESINVRKNVVIA